jgi:hypothetical protein
VTEHRAVSLAQHVLADFHDPVGPDAEDLAVKGGVMQGALRWMHAR